MNTLSERERKGSRIHDALRRLGLSSNYQGYAQMVCPSVSKGGAGKAPLGDKKYLSRCGKALSGYAGSGGEKPPHGGEGDLESGHAPAPGDNGQGSPGAAQQRQVFGHAFGLAGRGHGLRDQVRSSGVTEISTRGTLTQSKVLASSKAETGAALGRCPAIWARSPKSSAGE